MDANDISLSCIIIPHDQYLTGKDDTNVIVIVYQIYTLYCAVYLILTVLLEF